MANPKHWAILEEGAKAWNEWRETNPKISPDLRQARIRVVDLGGANFGGANLEGAHLEGAHLERANFWDANLRGVNLRRANLRKAKLWDADLRGAHLGNAKLRSADLRDADLRGAGLGNADLRNAKLQGANLRGANLQEAHLENADLGNAKFEDADLRGPRMSWNRLERLDLSNVNGLEEVHHENPSNISTETLALSQGKIPDAFLRGCGLSDWEIANAKLHDPTLSSDQIVDITYEVARIKAESPIQINPIFISYSHADTAFVEKLEKLLDAKRVRYWRDVHDMKAGRLETQIDRAIRHNPTVLMVLSEHSVESDWVEWEASKARELEREYRKEKKPRDVLCPIALDSSWKDSDWEGPLRKQIQKYNILDFSRWEDEAKMEETFQKLIDGLGLFYR